MPVILTEAFAKGAAVLWLQEGIIHQQAAEEAIAAGLKVAMDRCILKEHQRLIGSGKATEA